jgi:hypothetical protein
VWWFGWGRARRGGNVAGSFYNCRKAVTRPDSELWELRQWRWGEENIPPLTPSGEVATGIRGGLGVLDLTRRAELLWPRRGDRRGE